MAATTILAAISKCLLTPLAIPNTHLQRSSEPVFDDAEPEEPEYYEEPAENEEDIGGGEDPDAKTDERNIIHSGDPSAAAAAGGGGGKSGQKNTVEATKARKVDKENRTTTPYMTKYERARVLGTRALQIRYVCISRGSRCARKFWAVC